jgi:hypothetical protein
VKLDERELTKIKGANGAISWLAFNGRPELCAAASMIPRGYKEPDSTLVTDVNFAIKVAQTSKYSIKIWAIPSDIRRYFVFYDASFDPKGERNQLGRLVGCCSTKLMKGEEDLVSLGAWKSHKLEAKAGSPNATETHACAKAVADVTWYRALVESLTWSDWNKETLFRDGDDRPKSEPYVVSSDDPLALDPVALVIGDSKGVYDNLAKEQPGDERYSALQAAIIKERLSMLRGKGRWLPHDRNPADALTKFRGARALPLMTMLETGKFQLRAEKTELEDKAAAKKQLGYVPRPKTGVQVSQRRLQEYLTECSTAKERREVAQNVVTELRQFLVREANVSNKAAAGSGALEERKVGGL